MSTFTEVSAKVGKSIEDVKSKKAALDKAVEEVAKLNKEYQAALENGEQLKKELIGIMNETVPSDVKSKIG